MINHIDYDNKSKYDDNDGNAYSNDECNNSDSSNDNMTILIMIMMIRII